jgi:hypothetical protein
MPSVRHLKVLQDRAAPRSSSQSPVAPPGDGGGWRWIVLGTALTLSLWVALGLLLLELGPWAVVTAFAVAAALGGALVARLTAERPIRAAAMSGLLATLSSITFGIARGALSGDFSVFLALVLLVVVGSAASALGGKIAARGRASPTASGLRP